MSSAGNMYSLVLGILVVATQLSTVILLIGLVFKNYLPATIKEHLQFHGLTYAASIAFLAFLGPLGYSEVLGFDPCKLCWYQRIFMFPLALGLSLGVFRKETSFKPYGMLLAGIGASISLYHVLMQWGVISSASASCGVVGQSISCNVIFVHVFGYITIPVMALTAFVAIMVLLGYQKR